MSGTATSRRWDLVSATATASTGPSTPPRGMRFNPSKLLLDPYARAMDGDLVLDDAVFGSAPGKDRVQTHRDTAPYVPPLWSSTTRSPGVRTTTGRTAPGPTRSSTNCTSRASLPLHPGVPEPLRGTYAGLAHPAAIEHLQGLGVTAVELLPVHAFVSEPHLLRRGLTNYWGYNSIGFFAPHAAYSASGSRGEQVREFKAMVGRCTRPASR